MIVAITGGAGFIGRRLVQRHLQLGDYVRVLTRRERLPFAHEKLQVVQGELNGPSETLRSFAAGADVLYHCAGEIRDVDRMEEVHVHGAKRLIAAARGSIGRWVQLSSVGAYGPRSTGVIDEAADTAPSNLYEQTKTIADELVREAGAAGSFSDVILRPAIVFGPEMTTRSLFQWFSFIAKQRFFYIGPRGASANYVYVDDVADALVLCGTRSEAAGQIYNLCDGRTLEQFVDAIAASLGVAAPRLRVPALPVRLAARLCQNIPGNPLTTNRIAALTSRAVYRSDKIARQLGFRPQIGIEAGIGATVAAWQLKQFETLSNSTARSLMA